MREIRFRAWHKDCKVMEYDPLIKNGKYFEIIGNDIWGTSDDYILMQNTGLKDANGKEIYEGDIVRYTDSLYYKTIHQIVWNDNFACFSYKPYKFTDNGGDDDTTLSYTRKFEIIGNIYENPELLERENK